MRQTLQFAVMLVVVGALSAPSWALCLQEAASSTMACCKGVTSDCPETHEAMTCCAAGEQTGHQTNAARLEPVTASAMVHTHASLGAGLPGVAVPTLIDVAVAASLAPAPPHLINSVLLI